MEITNEQLQFVLTVLDEANQSIHSEFCYPGKCCCDNRLKAIEMLQNIQRTTADMRLANARPN